MPYIGDDPFYGEDYEIGHEQQPVRARHVFDLADWGDEPQRELPPLPPAPLSTPLAAEVMINIHEPINSIRPTIGWWAVTDDEAYIRAWAAFLHECTERIKFALAIYAQYGVETMQMSDVAHWLRVIPNAGRRAEVNTITPIP